MGLDAHTLKGLCRGAGVESQKLCEAIALVVRRLASTNTASRALEPFLAARLIPLAKKDGGVRPIGIGEVWRRLCGKVALRAARARIQKVCGNLQLVGMLRGRHTRITGTV